MPLFPVLKVIRLHFYGDKSFKNQITQSINSFDSWHNRWDSTFWGWMSLITPHTLTNVQLYHPTLSKKATALPTMLSCSFNTDRKWQCQWWCGQKSQQWSELAAPTEIFSVLQHITLSLDNKKITSLRNHANLPHNTTPQTSIHLPVTHTFCFIFHKVLMG